MPSETAADGVSRAREPVRFLDRATPPHIATLILLAGVSTLSMNMFLPSLPDMAAHFGVEYGLMQLSVALYLGMNAVMQIFIGPISDRFGRRPVMLASLVIFVLASLGCLMAPTIEVFLAFRMMQAAVVAGMVLSRAIVRDMVPASQAASMIGYVTMGMAVVPMIGPAIGGWLDAAFGWQSNFWAFAILGTVMLWMAWTDLGETAPRRSSSFAAQFAEYPELLRARRFWGYCAAAAFASGAFFAYLGGAPFVGTQVYGLSTVELGLYFGAPAVGYMVGNFLSGRFSVRLGINPMIAIGALVPAVGMALSLAITAAGADSPATFFGLVTLVGLGNGMTLPNATAGMLSVRPHLAGTAAGLGGAIMIGGGALLSALAGALLTPGSGATPLLLIMVVSSLAAVVSVAYVIWRERQLGGGAAAG